MFGVKGRYRDGDPRVAEALEEFGIKYEITQDGDYRFGFNLGDGRSQIGYIESETCEYAGIEIRKVFSVGLRSMGAFDAHTCMVLLEQNSIMKVGSWGVSKYQDIHLAIFSAMIAADLRGNELLAVITAVLKAADEMEQHLTGRDDF